MKTFLMFALGLSAAAPLLAASGGGITFQGMVASYSGTGRLTVERTDASYVYTLKIVGVQYGSPGNLTIRAVNSSIPNDVWIDSIQCDGDLGTLHATFPPGKTCACYVRSITVAGSVGTIQIDGGDLGASDARDGKVQISGSLGTLSLNGKSHKVPDTTLVEWWGGNCWADISVGGSVTKITTKGGNFYYDIGGGILGTMTVGGSLGQFYALGVTVKTNSSDHTSAIFRGGCINANIAVGNESAIQEIRSQGGIIIGGKISCTQLQKLSVYGQKAGAPMYVPAVSQGVFCTYVETVGALSNSLPPDIVSITMKNGNIRDSLFAVNGKIGTVNLTGDPTSGLLSNVVMRSGFGGDLSQNSTPYLYPSSISTTVFAGTSVTYPFRFNDDSNQELTVRIHYRDRALDAFLSNDYGQVFAGTNVWRVMPTTAAITGYFVWVSTTNTMVTASNIVVRVRDNGTPNKYGDLNLLVNAISNVVPVTLVVNPPDTPRTNAVSATQPTLWTLSVDHPLEQGPITYQVSGLAAFQLGIVISNAPPDVYAFTALSKLAGTYTGIVFSANNGFFTDTKVITLVLTGSIVAACSADAIPSPPPSSRAATAAPDASTEDTFVGDIGKIATVGNAYGCLFASAVSSPSHVWTNVLPFSSIKSLKIAGVALSNTFVTRKKINISNADMFDFIGNFIWVGGNLATNKYQ